MATATAASRIGTVQTAYSLLVAGASTVPPSPGSEQARAGSMRAMRSGSVRHTSTRMESGDEYAEDPRRREIGHADGHQPARVRSGSHAERLAAALVPWRRRYDA